MSRLKRGIRKKIKENNPKSKKLYKRYGAKEIDFVVEKLGAKLYEEPLTKNVPEVYFPYNAIVVDQNLPYVQRRYLIAHSLAHHLFHRKDLFSDYIGLQEKGIFGSLKLGRIEKESKEKEADLFAAYFLIPDEKLKPILKEEWIKESSNPIPELAEKFQVPVELMRMRLEFEGVNSKF